MYHLIAEKNKSQFLRLISREYFFAKAQVNLQFSFNIKIARKIGDSLLIAHQNTRLKLNNRWSHFTLGALAFQIFHDDSMQETTLKSFVIFFFNFPHFYVFAFASANRLQTLHDCRAFPNCYFHFFFVFLLNVLHETFLSHKKN